MAGVDANAAPHSPTELGSSRADSLSDETHTATIRADDSVEEEAVMRTDEEVPTAVGTPTSPAGPVPMELSAESVTERAPGASTEREVFILNCPQGLPASEVHLVKDADGNDHSIVLGTAAYAAEMASQVDGQVQSLAETSDEHMPNEAETAAVDESYVKAELPDFDADQSTLTAAGETASEEAVSSTSQLPIAGRAESEMKGNKKPNNRIQFDLKRDEVDPDAMDEGA